MFKDGLQGGGEERKERRKSIFKKKAEVTQ